ncbi:MAG: hypothetical protein EOL93_00510 [Epsilonproteobacteria bacterium]|nr:hypothetical protein [Campylobacterota bacterium]
MGNKILAMLEIVVMGFVGNYLFISFVRWDLDLLGFLARGDEEVRVIYFAFLCASIAISFAVSEILKDFIREKN